MMTISITLIFSMKDYNQCRVARCVCVCVCVTELSSAASVGVLLQRPPQRLYRVFSACTGVCRNDENKLGTSAVQLTSCRL